MQKETFIKYLVLIIVKCLLYLINLNNLYRLNHNKELQLSAI